jgi:hypothetical protein
MLYWREKPHPLLTLLVDEALGRSLDFASVLGATWFVETYPRSADLFTLRKWRREVEKLRSANRCGRVFRPTEYHWLILYEILGDFSERYNRGSLSRIIHDQTAISRIDFDGIVTGFFWHIDFTVPLEKLSGFGAEETAWMGFRGGAMDIAAGLPPHPTELELAEVREPGWEEALQEGPVSRCPPGTGPVDLGGYPLMTPGLGSTGPGFVRSWTQS